MYYDTIPVLIHIQILPVIVYALRESLPAYPGPETRHPIIVENHPQIDPSWAQVGSKSVPNQAKALTDWTGPNLPQIGPSRAKRHDRTLKYKKVEALEEDRRFCMILGDNLRVNNLFFFVLSCPRGFLKALRRSFGRGSEKVFNIEGPRDRCSKILGSFGEHNFLRPGNISDKSLSV